MKTQLKTTLVLCLASGALLLSGCAFKSGEKQAPPIPQRLTTDLPSRNDGAVFELDPNEVAKVNLELASNYYAYQQLDSAMEAVNRVLALQPENARALITAGFIQLDLKDQAKSEQYFVRALKNAPQDPEVLHNYATFLCRTKREVQSVDYFDGALKVPTYRRPGLTQASAGMCLMKIGRNDEAFTRFEDALSFEPMQFQALIGSAELLFDQGKFSPSRDRLMRYLRVAPSTAQSIWLDLRLSRALGLKSDENMAYTDLKKNYPNSDQFKKYNAGDFSR